MSIRGLPQLVGLELHYCPSSGSSHGVRDFILHHLPAFHSEHSQVAFSLIRKSHRHPVLIGSYRNGRSVVVPLRQKLSKEVLGHANQLRSSIGRTSPPRYWPLAQSRNSSIQGHWVDARNFEPLQVQINRIIEKDQKVLGVAQKLTNQTNNKQ